MSFNPYFESHHRWKTEECVGMDWFDASVYPSNDCISPAGLFLKQQATWNQRNHSNPNVQLAGLPYSSIRCPTPRSKMETAGTYVLLAVGVDVHGSFGAQEQALQSNGWHRLAERSPSCHESRNALQRIHSRLEISNSETSTGFPRCRPDVGFDCNVRLNAFEKPSRRGPLLTRPIHAPRNSRLPEIWRAVWRPSRTLSPKDAMSNCANRFCGDGCELPIDVPADRNKCFRNSLFENVHRRHTLTRRRSSSDCRRETRRRDPHRVRLN